MAVQLESPVLAYYRRTAPLLDRLFGPIPVVAASFPNGDARMPLWHRAVPLTRKSLLWLCEHEDAVEFHSWTPTATDPQRARFARILLEADAQAVTALPRAMHALHEIVEETRAVAVPLVTGASGAALWIPFADAPEYPSVRAWLHEICNEAVRRKPQLFTTEPNSHNSRRVHLHAGSNAPGRFSILPYALRGDRARSVCLPLQWSEIDTVTAGSVVLENVDGRLESAGEVFEPQVERLNGQRFSQVRHVVRLIVSGMNHLPHAETSGNIVRGVAAILEDGVARTAREICEEGVARKLFSAATSERYVYTSLSDYVARARARGRRPAFAQDADHRFRIDEEPDPWPASPQAPKSQMPPATQALVERLKTTANCGDPAAFEIAVCDAFAHLGFAATHMGGIANPDGYADALLGPLGYRVMLECTTDDVRAHNAHVSEASNYRDRYRGQYCALVGPSYADSTELEDELEAHRVSAWAVDDLVALLQTGANPQEIRALFEPGFAFDALQSLMRERRHGRRKRVGLICEYLREAGWNQQIAAHRQGIPQSAPSLDENAAMLMVDQQLAELGSTASCSREDVRAAFEYLTNPMVGSAMWVDAVTREAIVIL